MYTNEQKMKAVELYIKYNHRATQVSRELGYPHPNFIARWYKEYLQNGTFRTKYKRQNKYDRRTKTVCFAVLLGAWLLCYSNYAGFRLS